MAKAPGVTRRRSGDRPTGLLQAHVDTDVREKVRDMATASGVTMAAFLEATIRREPVDDQGRPLWWRELPAKRNNDKELPLTG